MTTRAEREKQAADETSVYEEWHRMQRRFAHVFTCPNSQRRGPVQEALMRDHLAGAAVLEIGCGTGGFAAQLSQRGAVYVLGVDISEKRIEEAKQHESPGVLEYACADVSQPQPGRYDLIVGQAVLHHVDYQEVIPRLMQENLKPGGLMLFYEPLAANWFMRLFRRFSKQSHTSDEHPFDLPDLAWLRARYPAFSFIPFNFVSIPLGVLSSLLFRSPENALLRAADTIDWYLAQHARWLHPYFRTALFVFPAKEK